MSLCEQTVFIVDDEISVRDSLRWLLESIRLRIETFDSAESFLSNYTPDRAGCLVLDVRMPGISGPELLDMMNHIGEPIPIIFLSAHGDVPLTVRAMKGGAFDFLQKPYNNQEFLNRVRQALALDLSRRNQRKGLDEYSARLAALTLRERQVLDRVVDGQSNKLVARELGISYKTVEVHRSRLMHKMGAASFNELLRQALTHSKSRT
ncbi:MAG: response regulator transcription factor [Rhodanobacter sp.]|nr:MAG: response regulator transcription factor [Rhodanobacter sp.]TAL97383.1 MAG: response regulator transcription factor [Rhodanobacter sp.]TAM43080.1 MAG: response regulator transcription factor [Rhodanobacter sp.]TAN28812.1 MAG: response regulator transcription factor [Rhodanobacter sp.]